MRWEPVQAVRFNTYDDMVNSGLRGAFCIDSQGLWYVCPCGCGAPSYLPFRPAKPPSWDFDNDYEYPTLKPSIRRVGFCKFHGYLTVGTWTFCPDSGL